MVRLIRSGFFCSSAQISSRRRGCASNLFDESLPPDAFTLSTLPKPGACCLLSYEASKSWFAFVVKKRKKDHCADPRSIQTMHVSLICNLLTLEVTSTFQSLRLDAKFAIAVHRGYICSETALSFKTEKLLPIHSKEEWMKLSPRTRQTKV
jgi:hypothetical protein